MISVPARRTLTAIAAVAMALTLSSCSFGFKPTVTNGLPPTTSTTPVDGKASAKPSTKATPDTGATTKPGATTTKPGVATTPPTGPKTVTLAEAEAFTRNAANEIIADATRALKASGATNAGTILHDLNTKRKPESRFDHTDGNPAGVTFKGNFKGFICRADVASTGVTFKLTAVSCS